MGILTEIYRMPNGFRTGIPVGGLLRVRGAQRNQPCKTCGVGARSVVSMTRTTFLWDRRGGTLQASHSCGLKLLPLIGQPGR